MSGVIDTETNPFQRQLDNLNYRIAAAMADDDATEQRGLYREYLTLWHFFENPDREAERRAIVAAGGTPIAYVPPIDQTTKAANVSPPRHAHREETPIMHTNSTASDLDVINAITIECDLRLSQLEVAPEYQRPIRQVWLRKLIREFDPSLVGKIDVAERDGHYYVTDGQHRVEAMRVTFAGDDRLVRCDVRMVETAEEQARLFVMLNTARAPLRNYEIFRARLASGDPDALVMVEVLAEYGFRPNLTSNGSMTGGTTSAFGTLLTLYGARSMGLARTNTSGAYGGVGGGSEARLRAALDVIVEANTSDIVLTANILRTTDVFLHRYATHPNYQRRRFVEMLRRVDIDHGPDVSAVIAAFHLTSRHAAAVIAIAQKYNTGRGAERRLPIRLEEGE